MDFFMFKSILGAAVLAVGLPAVVHAADGKTLDCSIFDKEGYATYNARIENGLETLKKVRAIINTQKAEEIRQYVVDNIDERMEQHRGRSDQEYWMKSEIRDLCRRESERVFEKLVLEHGAEPLNEMGRTILEAVYPHPQLDNDLQPLTVLWRLQPRLGCTGTYADALAMRSREFETAYNRSNCPLRFKK